MTRFILGENGKCLRARFGELRRAVTSNDIKQPFAKHFNSGGPSILDMKRLSYGQLFFLVSVLRRTHVNLVDNYYWI